MHETDGEAVDITNVRFTNVNLDGPTCRTPSSSTQREDFILLDQ